jgi:MATE family multidrug resistance protein
MADQNSLNKFLDTPFKSFFRLWVPVLFSLIAEPLTGLVDTGFVSRLGAEELAALGVGTVVLSGGLWLFNFLSVGSQTEVSQASGQGDLDRGRRIGSLALIVGLAVGCAASLLVFIGAPLLSEWMGAAGQIQDHAVRYIRIRSLGGPAVLFSMVSFGILYGLADMRTPLLVALAVNGLNIVLDALLIFGMGPVPPLGIGGAALASSLSQWVGACCCAAAVYAKIGFTFHIAVADIMKLLTIGRDMFVRTGMLIIFLLLATRSATRLGPEAGAAHQAIRQVWIFTNLFLDAAAITAQSVVGYYYGSGRQIQAIKVAGLVCTWSLLIGIGLLILMLIGTTSFAALLVPVSAVAQFRPAWIVAALFQPLAALAFVTDGIHWGTGDFIYLRNAVCVATVAAGTVLLISEWAAVISLDLIWWCTGLWIVVRAGLGMARMWPGWKTSPLGGR